jgi:hypothetical protein
MPVFFFLKGKFHKTATGVKLVGGGGDYISPQYTRVKWKGKN